MSKGLLEIFIVGLVVFFVSNPVLGNILREGDANPFLQLGNSALTLDKDINQAMYIIGQHRDYDQASCLAELTDFLAPMIDRLLFAHDLITISAKMTNSEDEAIVNVTLTKNIVLQQKLLAASRQHALAQAALCSNSAIVNTYAHDMAAIADKASALFYHYRQ